MRLLDNDAVVLTAVLVAIWAAMLAGGVRGHCDLSLACRALSCQLARVVLLGRTPKAGPDRPVRLPVIAFAYGTQDCSLVAARKLTARRELMMFDPAQPDFFCVLHP